MKKLKKIPVSKYFIILAFLFLSNSLLKAQSVEHGLKAIDYEKYKEARIIFENLTRDNPKDADAFYYLGKLDIMEGKVGAAQTNFQKGFDADKNNALNIVGFGLVQLVKGNQTEAEKKFEEAVDEAGKKDVNVPLNIADAYLLSDSKDLSKAIDILNNANKINKKNPVIFTKLGDIYLKNFNGSQAISNYQTAIDYDKKYIKPYAGIAQIYIKIKNNADAEANLDKALLLDSSYSPAYKILGEYYYARKQYDKAALNYGQYINFSESSADKKVRYATFLYLAKKYKEAIAEINQITGNERENSQLQHILAFSYFSLDDTQNGLPAFDKYFKMITPKEITSTDYEYVGKLLLKQGKDSLAIETLNKAIALDSSRADLHGEIAGIFFKNKKWSDAAREYALKELTSGKILSIKELFDQGQAYYHDSMFGKADTIYAKVTQVNPDLALGYYWRALSNVQLDPESEKGLAKPHYEKFIEVAAKSTNVAKYKNHIIEAYSYLGYFYYLQKDNIQSRVNWLKVQELDTENTRAKEALKAIPLK
ncbi:MAG: tetratricopeptide repeat protein [Ignavibacteria bacterium]